MFPYSDLYMYAYCDYIFGQIVVFIAFYNDIMLLDICHTRNCIHVICNSCCIYVKVVMAFFFSDYTNLLRSNKICAIIGLN